MFNRRLSLLTALLLAGLSSADGIAITPEQEKCYETLKTTKWFSTDDHAELKNKGLVALEGIITDDKKGSEISEMHATTLIDIFSKTKESFYRGPHRALLSFADAFSLDNKELEAAKELYSLLASIKAQKDPETLSEQPTTPTIASPVSEESAVQESVRSACRLVEAPESQEEASSAQPTAKIVSKNQEVFEKIQKYSEAIEQIPEWFGVSKALRDQSSPEELLQLQEACVVLQESSIRFFKAIVDSMTKWPEKIIGNEEEVEPLGQTSGLLNRLKDLFSLKQGVVWHRPARKQFIVLAESFGNALEERIVKGGGEDAKKGTTSAPYRKLIEAVAQLQLTLDRADAE